MKIVDGQVHLWAEGWVPGARAHHRQQPVFSAEELLGEMEEAGVDRVLIVPPNWNDVTARNDYALDSARRYPDRFAVMGTLPVERPESRARIEGWRQQQGMKGLRLVFLGNGAAALTDGTSDWLWAAADQQKLPIMIYAPGQLPGIAGIAERYPGIRFIIDHFGVNVSVHGEAAFVSLPDVLSLARHGNIGVKLSGAPSLASDAYPFRSVDPYIRRIYDAFGPQRMFWGTDLTRMPCSYKECVTQFTQEIPWLTESDKTLIMGQAIADWIDWPL